MGKKKFYVVWSGKKTGIFQSWEECKEQVQGVAGAKYKAFETMQEAEAAFASSYEQFITKKKNKITYKNNPRVEQPILESLAVDAACSGNPGVMEYRGVWVKDSKEIFRKKFPLGTNNIGEFLAIVRGLYILHKQGLNSVPIYSDSEIAISWVKQKKCKTKLERNQQTESLFQAIEAAENWLRTTNINIPVLKWQTEIWGEIPADFGRK